MLGYLVSDIRRVLTSCSTWKSSFICKGGNKVIRVFAKFARYINDYVSWMEDVPKFMLPLLYADASVVN